MTAAAPAVGIEALNVYAGLAAIEVADLFAGRGLDPARQGNLMLDRRSVGLPCEDPVTNAVNAAKPLLDALAPPERARVELLVTSTESGVDYSKSVASYVHHYLGLPATCRVMEAKQACYAATGALQLAAGYVASGLSPGAKALVIATDVAVVDAYAQYAEPATGHGAVALLVGDEPQVLTLDPGAFGLHSYETLDSARPAPDQDVADADRSLFAYLDCLDRSFADYADRVEGADFGATFDRLALHTPFAGLVRSAHRKMTRDWTSLSPQDAGADFDRRVAPSLAYPRQVGNLCSGSVYLALASSLDAAPCARPERVGLFSYGSGCASEFFSGVVTGESARAVGRMRIGERLAARRTIDFAEYTRLLKVTRSCLVPERNREVTWELWEDYLDSGERAGDLLVHTGVTDYHRTYAWS
ncbi:hydroxymethylglutaryl-CoA synthase [Streptomyces sp. NPDC047968]|uniref:hydroxymethylglutaryl-CoA synthase family protein n=1 Tax=unclassified Streptomyces TaxID=2593676 RepID=UPI00341815AF